MTPRTTLAPSTAELEALLREAAFRAQAFGEAVHEVTGEENEDTNFPTACLRAADALAAAPPTPAPAPGPIPRLRSMNPPRRLMKKLTETQYATLHLMAEYPEHVTWTMAGILKAAPGLARHFRRATLDYLQSENLIESVGRVEYRITERGRDAIRYDERTRPEVAAPPAPPAAAPRPEGGGAGGVLLTFINVPEGHEVMVGPFPFVQVTYDDLRVGEDGERFIAQRNAAGLWEYEGRTYTDFSIAPRAANE